MYIYTCNSLRRRRSKKQHTKARSIAFLFSLSLSLSLGKWWSTPLPLSHGVVYEGDKPMMMNEWWMNNEDGAVIGFLPSFVDFSGTLRLDRIVPSVASTAPLVLFPYDAQIPLGSFLGNSIKKGETKLNLNRSSEEALLQSRAIGWLFLCRSIACCFCVDRIDTLPEGNEA
jgi:hypothetical protein